MKKFLIRFAGILVYFFIAAYICGFQLSLLFDVRGIMAVLAGTVFFSVPAAAAGNGMRAFREVLARNAATAGYIATFLFLFSRFSGEKGYDSLLSDIALNCRPLLYGMLLHLLLKPERRTQEKHEYGCNEQYAESEPEEAENQTECSGENCGGNEETGAAVHLSAQQIYDMLHERGLTQREAEVAFLAYNKYSNREIAEKLFISEATVKKHMSHIFEKLEIKSREELKRSIVGER